VREMGLGLTSHYTTQHVLDANEIKRAMTCALEGELM
jgi:hypothetical protein